MEPRAKTSMTIMRPPQHGHGRGRTREPSGSVFSGGCVSPWPPTAQNGEQRAGLGDVLRAPAIGQKPVMPNTVEALGRTCSRKRRMNSCVASLMVL